MKRVLFVCHGNICRSPMAQFIFNDLLKRRGLEKECAAESAAVSYEEEGNGLYYAVREELQRRGVPYAAHHARRMQKEDYARFDVIAVMDQSNLSAARRILCGDPDGKVHLLLEYAGLSRSISDPWYTRDFGAAYEDILLGCEALLTHLFPNK